MGGVPDELLRFIEEELRQPVPAGAHVLTARLRERFGSSVRAVLMYGSCLRTGDDRESLLDLYVFVDDYRQVYERTLLMVLNRLLPPNVFYIEDNAEAEGQEYLVRAKYAIVAHRDLLRFTSTRTFEPYFWARFAQPCALVYAADEQARRDVVNALATAVVTYVSRGVPLVGARFNSQELWIAMLRATYRCELRAERPHAAENLYASGASRFEALTPLALAALPALAVVEEKGDPAHFTVHLPAQERQRALRQWQLRRPHGKLRFLLRILRNAFTFDGGVDYAMWKIQRHTGIEPDRSWRHKRFPLLALGAEAWRLYRAGAFR